MTARSLTLPHTFTSAQAAAALLGSAAVLGWMLNAAKLMSTGLPMVQWGASEAIRMAGVVVAPLGAVAGYLF
ncbi:hypothetical protein [Xylophilus sp.]|uniref:hypothetical protein n=1 Tax=Xylophilus sp. TaxID=2653893 RepID=UPI0013BA7481|nr:hypothetical protein [Xylophilus sp.]KAF1043461.1 MAG: hypothetical protein GAK38_03958 [Xylophilus sp.]